MAIGHTSTVLTAARSDRSLSLLFQSVSVRISLGQINLSQISMDPCGSAEGHARRSAQRFPSMSERLSRRAMMSCRRKELYRSGKRSGIPSGKAARRSLDGEQL